MTGPFAAALTAASFLGIVYIATDQPVRMPSDILTPGAIRSQSREEICSPGYARAHRVWRSKADTLRKYSLPLAAAPEYEDDDRVPVCLGGDNADPRNHWPQPLGAAREKDRLEVQVCRAVCAGTMSLQEGQELFLGDWRRGK